MNNNQLIGVSDLNEIALPAADLLLLWLVVGNELIIGTYQTAMYGIALSADLRGLWRWSAGGCACVNLCVFLASRV